MTRPEFKGQLITQMYLRREWTTNGFQGLKKMALSWMQASSVVFVHDLLANTLQVPELESALVTSSKCCFMWFVSNGYYRAIQHGYATLVFAWGSCRLSDASWYLNLNRHQ